LSVDAIYEQRGDTLVVGRAFKEITVLNPERDRPFGILPSICTACFCTICILKLSRVKVTFVAESKYL